jgi:hypothetical protein
VNSEEGVVEGEPERRELDPPVGPEPADHTATPGHLAKVLREGVDWKEVFQRRESFKRTG